LRFGTTIVEEMLNNIFPSINKKFFPIQEIEIPSDAPFHLSNSQRLYSALTLPAKIAKRAATTVSLIAPNTLF
jgi:hypothetical protein